MNPELDYKLSVIRGAHPEWTYERAFQHVMSQDKFTGTFGRPKPDMALVAVANGLAASPSAHLTAPKAEPAPGAPKAVPARHAAHVKATPKIGFVSDGSRHPFSVEAKARGLNLVEGGLCGWFMPLPGTVE